MWFNFCAFLNWAAAGTVPSWSVSLGTVSKHFKSLFWKSAEVKKHPHGRATSGACPVQFHRCLAQVKCSPGPHPYSICGGNGSAQGRNCKKMLVIWFQERQICTSAHDLTSHMRGSTNPVLPTPIRFQFFSPSWSKACSHHSSSPYLLFDVFAGILIRPWRKGIRIDEFHFSGALLKN